MRLRAVNFMRIGAALVLVAAQCIAPMAAAAADESPENALRNAEYGRVARMLERDLPDLAKASVIQLRALCYSYHQLKAYRKFFQCLDRWDLIADGDDEPPFVGSLHTALPLRVRMVSRDTLRAEALIELGDYKRAIESAQRVYRRREENNNIFTFGYRQKMLGLPALAIAHALSGDRKRAQQYVEMMNPDWTARISPVVGPEVQIDLARVNAALGDFAKALEHARNADYANARTVFNVLGVLLAFKGGQVPLQSEHVYTSLPRLFLLNKSLFETGAVAEAKRGYDYLLTRHAIADNGEIHWMVLYDRGRIAEQEQNIPAAIEFYRRAIEIIERNRASINTEASKIGYVGDRQSVYGRLIAALARAGDVAAAFHYVERAKSRALVDMLAQAREFSAPAADTGRIQELLAEAEHAESDARIQDSSRPSPSARGGGAELLQQVAAQSEELGSLTSVRVATLAEIRSRLARDEALIEYFISDENAFAFVLDQQRLIVVPLQRKGFEVDLEKFRSAIGDPGQSEHAGISRRVYERLFAPLAEVINRPNLLIVPHGGLHYIPFGALFDGTQHLIERYGIRLLPSSSVLKYIPQEPAAKPGKMLAIGDPELGNPRLRLAMAREEAIRIAGLHPNSLSLVDSKATETAFRTLGSGFSYLHIASHGEFLPDAPLQSALLLAPDAQNDGMMTVGELFALRLEADLVTLSACETGLGSISRGDDVVGLTRGFLYAGSRSIVASLWKVEDGATADLMTMFYTMLDKSDRREALRQAQIRMMARNPHPFFWAAFQLTGSVK